ncbi:AMP-binding protein [Streptomyces sp. NPDC048417]|uniref:class I adenylate-forming enzyme family protein n=1 Tax=Streptomyces sp. NPDC048417 TaxID=3155387 RepID=UPI003437BF6C
MNATAHELSASRTLWDLVVSRAELTPGRPVFLQGDRTLSFGALRARAERAAAGLYGMGVRPGTVVAWQLPTRVETAVLSFALARLGAVQSPVIPFYRDREVGFALRESRAEFFAVPGVWRGFDHTEMARRLGAKGIFEAYDELPDGDPSVLPAPPAEGTSVRWIYWTSGTTSDPKGVLHTDRSLIAGGSCLAHALRLTAADVGSMAFPYAHIAGPDYTVMLLLYGFPAVMFEQFALPDALPEYRRHGVTVAGGSTAFYSMFLAEQRRQPGVPVIPSLRLLAGGGAPKPPEVYHAVVREMGVQLTHGYGMTEVPMITMGAPDDTAENLATTEGKPPEGMEIRIAAGGEIRLRGEAVCQGYLDPAQTAEAFDEEGFLRTGDLGQMTESGHLVLTGRLKDVIIRKGENISAKEIEDLLAAHPAVGDAAVVGLPDAERGELVCAVLEQPPGAAALTLPEVVAYLRAEGLSVHKLPERLEVVDALPRNETLRKVLKYKLRDRFSTTSTPGAAKAHAPESPGTAASESPGGAAPESPGTPASGSPGGSTSGSPGGAAPGSPGGAAPGSTTPGS